MSEPSTAMPSATPSSYAVSETEEAAPAFAGGTAETTASTLSVSEIPIPSPRGTSASSTQISCSLLSSSASSPRPRAPVSRASAIARPRPSRVRSVPTRSTAAIAESAAGSCAMPASKGLSCRASWRYCEKKNSTPLRAKTEVKFTSTAPLNAGLRNSSTSIIGESARRWRRTNSTLPITPTPTAATVTVLAVPPVTCLIASTKGTIATIDRALESRSNRSGAGLRDSGSSQAPPTSTAAITGRFIRNTEPHQKCSSNAPPISGPSAMPLAAAADHSAMARVRSAASVKMLRISDRVEGMIVAPAIPSRSRAAISTPADGAKAASAEASPKAVAPISSSRLRPMRSARLPMVTSSPAMARE